LTPTYFDAAYVAKCYLVEPDSDAVRALAHAAHGVYTSEFSIAEVSCVFRRHRREGTLDRRRENTVRDQFLTDLAEGRWLIVPVTRLVMGRVESLTRALPARLPIRAGDATHIASALEARIPEICTNDRRLIEVAKHFGLTGKTV
jgi:predicted nucleic acid-binding protein